MVLQCGGLMFYYHPFEIELFFNRISTLSLQTDLIQTDSLNSSYCWQFNTLGEYKVSYGCHNKVINDSFVSEKLSQITQQTNKQT